MTTSSNKNFALDNYVYTCYNIIAGERTERMRSMKDKGLLKLLLDNGWTLVKIHESHHIVEKNGQIETIPVHGKDVPNGLLSVILKRTGLEDVL